MEKVDALRIFKQWCDQRGFPGLKRRIKPRVGVTKDTKTGAWVVKIKVPYMGIFDFCILPDGSVDASDFEKTQKMVQISGFANTEEQK